MAKQKFKITEDSFEFNFTVLAVASQSRDYHLCWQINRELAINLRRGADLQVSDAKKQQINYFSFYSFIDDNDMSRYYFVANKSGNHLFLPQLKVADFLLVINEKPKEEIKKIISVLKKIPQVVAITEIEIDKLKLKRSLIFE
jgi:hypothetical protein